MRYLEPFLNDARRWVIECHGVGVADDHYRDPRYNGAPVRELLASMGVAMVIPRIDPWDGADTIRDAMLDVAERFEERPWLTGQCVGGLTALHTLARWPGRFAGALLLNPVSDPCVMRAAYPDADRASAPDLAAIVDPVTVWHGDDDRTSPVEPSRSLPFDVHIIEGGRHTHLTADAYLAGLREVFGG